MKKIEEGMKLDRYGKYLKDIRESKYVIIGSIFIAIAIGFLFMLLMRFIAGLIIWLFIVLIGVVFAALGLLFFTKYTSLT